MNQKLKSVLLVDDDPACNFMHKIVLNELQSAEKIQVALNGKEALDFIKTTTDAGQAPPDIIFLDLNMPVMDGWEFLTEFEKLIVNYKVKPVLVVLTSSVNIDDEERAKTFTSVTAFKNKFLTDEMMTGLLSDYFPEG